MSPLTCTLPHAKLHSLALADCKAVLSVSLDPCRRQVAREAAKMQRAAAEREHHVHLHAKREADRAERDHHANAEVLDSRPVLLTPTV